jgi:hypothetical protein
MEKRKRLTKIQSCKYPKLRGGREKRGIALQPIPNSQIPRTLCSWYPHRAKAPLGNSYSEPVNEQKVIGSENNIGNCIEGEAESHRRNAS